LRQPDENLQQFCQDGHVWRVHADDVSRLRERIIPSLFQADQSLGLVLIKETDSRLILKGEPDDVHGSFIVKVFKHHPVKDGVKSLFRSPRSLKEWRVGLTLLKKAIPAPVPIAAGVPQKISFSGRDYFISQEVVGAQSVADWVENELLQGSVPFPEKRVIIRALAVFVRTMHDRGVYSSDLHQGNILIRAPRGQTPRFYLTDFHAIRFRTELRHRERVKNLVQLNSFRVSMADRLRFLKDYYQAEEHKGISIKNAAREIGAASDKHWKHLWNRRKRKCLRPGRRFEHFAVGQWSGMTTRERISEELQQLIKNAAFDLSGFRSRNIKEGSRTVINEVALPKGEELEHLVIKSYNTGGVLSRLKALLRMSRAERAWIHAHQLVMRGIPTPAPVAFGQKGPWGIRQVSIFLTVKIPTAQGSDIFLKELPQQFTDREQRVLKKDFLVRLARMIRWMHVTGLCHGDLKASNILVTIHEKELSVFLVDMDGMKMRNRMRVRDVARDLSRLKAAFTEVLSQSEYEHFLNIYRKGNPFFQTHHKKILEVVHALTAKKIRQKQRSNLHRKDTEAAKER